MCEIKYTGDTFLPRHASVVKGEEVVHANDMSSDEFSRLNSYYFGDGSLVKGLLSLTGFVFLIFCIFLVISLLTGSAPDPHHGHHH